MFGSHERSLKALSGFYNLVAVVTFPSNHKCKNVKKNQEIAILSILFRSK